MFARNLSIIFAAAVMIAGAAMPAAADDIEAKVGVCGLCHGTDGRPVGPEIPVIWGQKQNYLVKEIHDYRAGDRYNALMAPVAHGIAQEDTRPIGAYFAAKPGPKARPPPPAPTPPSPTSSNNARPATSRASSAATRARGSPASTSNISPRPWTTSPTACAPTISTCPAS